MFCNNFYFFNFLPFFSYYIFYKITNTIIGWWKWLRIIIAKELRIVILILWEKVLVIWIVWIIQIATLTQWIIAILIQTLILTQAKIIYSNYFCKSKNSVFTTWVFLFIIIYISISSISFCVFYYSFIKFFFSKIWKICFWKIKFCIWILP